MHPATARISARPLHRRSAAVPGAPTRGILETTSSGGSKSDRLTRPGMSVGRGAGWSPRPKHEAAATKVAAASALAGQHLGVKLSWACRDMRAFRHLWTVQVASRILQLPGARYSRDDRSARF